MDTMASRLRDGAVRVVTSWGPEERDAVLYAASGLFAILTAETSSITLYQQWGKLAAGPYVLGAVLSALAARASLRRARRTGGAVSASARHEGGAGSSWHWTTPRMTIFLLVLIGATLLPLSLEVLWRSDTGGTAHVQPEVAVVENSGNRVL